MGRQTRPVRSPVIDVLVAAIDQGFDRKSWHGTNLRGAIRGITAKQASWRPGPGRHNAWEIVLHAAYWKYVVRRRLLGEKRGSFPLEGSNWLASPKSPSEAQWRAAVRLLEEVHRSMRAAVLALTPADLPNKGPRGTTTTLGLVTGIAAHDLYHAGQIQLLKRLRPSR
jgi:DinB superfamily